MEQSTVLILVGIMGNLVLVGLLIFAWRLLMGGDQDPNARNEAGYTQSGAAYAQGGAISNRELDELLANPDARRSTDGDQLAGLFRFDSWSSARSNGMATNGRSSAADS